MNTEEWQRFQAIVKPGMRVRYTGAEPKRSDNHPASLLSNGDEGMLTASDVDGREDLFENLPVSAFEDPHNDPFYVHPFSMDYWIDGKWVPGQRVYNLMLIAQVHELINWVQFLWRGEERPLLLSKDEYWLVRKVAEMQIEESISLPIDRDALGNIRFLGHEVVIQKSQLGQVPFHQKRID